MKWNKGEKENPIGGLCGNHGCPTQTNAFSREEPTYVGLFSHLHYVSFSNWVSLPFIAANVPMSAMDPCSYLTHEAEVLYRIPEQTRVWDIIWCEIQRTDIKCKRSHLISTFLISVICKITLNTTSTLIILSTNIY
jgi:hypothetical protein